MPHRQAGRRGPGRQAVLVRGDISDAGYCCKVIAAAVDAFGKVDVLVNSAAYQMTQETLEEISDEEWDRSGPR
jgi:hypothetical protein